jgi:hypothetical protein
MAKSHAWPALAVFVLINKLDAGAFKGALSFVQC